MKLSISKGVFVALAALMIVTLACGSSDVVVNTPTPEKPSNVQQPEQQQPVPTQIPASTRTPQIGTARSNPAPVGSEVVVDDMAFVVLSKIRPADSIVSAGNPFNTEPETGKEYLFVELKITCRKTTDEKCSFSPIFSTKIIGSKGIEYDPDIFVAGVAGLLESVDFYGDATVAGYIPFIIDQEDASLLLVYEPFLGKSFYLQIPE